MIAEEKPEPPYSHDLEFRLLGAAVSMPGLMAHLGIVMPEHFHSPVHAALFKAMRDLHDRGEAISPFNLAIDPETAHILKEAVGSVPKYLSSAVASSVSLIYPAEEAKALVDMAKRRELIELCEKHAFEARDVSKSAVEHIAAVSRGVESIGRSFETEKIEDDAEITQQILRDLQDSRRPFSTGFPKLDEAMGGGLYPGRSYGFAARKKVGKTVLASTISCNLNLQGVRHLFICGEMSPKEIQQRNLARLTDSYPSAFRNDYGQSEAFQQKLVEQAERSRRCILYQNAPGLTFDELRRMCASAVCKRGVKGVILDYWQLVGGKQPRQSTAEHLDDVAQWLADFGRKHGLFMVVMAQINQEGNTRGGEGIRLAFDQVYQINREDISMPQVWLEMMDTRYTPWLNIGSKLIPGLVMNDKGPYFEEL